MNINRLISCLLENLAIVVSLLSPIGLIRMFHFGTEIETYQIHALGYLGIRGLLMILVAQGRAKEK